MPPSAPTMKACKVTVKPLSDSHSLRGVYVLSFSALAVSKEFTSPSYGMVTSTMVATFFLWFRVTRSGWRSPGASRIFCSTNLSPASRGTALTRRLRMALCLSRIRFAFGIQAFSMWPRISGAWWHFGQVVSISGWPALLATVFVG